MQLRFHTRQNLNLLSVARRLFVCCTRRQLQGMRLRNLSFALKKHLEHVESFQEPHRLGRFLRGLIEVEQVILSALHLLISESHGFLALFIANFASSLPPPSLRQDCLGAFCVEIVLKLGRRRQTFLEFQLQPRGRRPFLVAWSLLNLV